MFVQYASNLAMVKFFPHENCPLHGTTDIVDNAHYEFAIVILIRVLLFRFR